MTKKTKAIDQKRWSEPMNRAPSNDFPETAYAMFRFKEQFGVELLASSKLGAFQDGERVGIYKLVEVKTVRVKRSLGK